MSRVMERIALCLHRSIRCSDSSRSSCLRTSIGRTAVRPSSGTLTCSTGGTSECAVSVRPDGVPRRAASTLPAVPDAPSPTRMPSGRSSPRGLHAPGSRGAVVFRASGCVQWRRVHRGPPRGGDDEHLVRAARVPCSGAVCAEWRDCRLLPARDRAWSRVRLARGRAILRGYRRNLVRLQRRAGRRRHRSSRGVATVGLRADLAKGGHFHEGLPRLRLLRRPAVKGVNRIGSDYEGHCAATRVVAESYFDSDAVIGGCWTIPALNRRVRVRRASALAAPRARAPGVARVRRLELRSRRDFPLAFPVSASSSSGRRARGRTARTPRRRASLSAGASTS